MATYNIKGSGDRKEEVAKRLKSAYELFRENLKGSDSGAGSYGQGDRDIGDQFESHYTMGYEMGIWQDSDFTLNPLAKKVAQYEMTVSEYIGIVFTNLFAFYTKNEEVVYHHFLYEILNNAKSKGVIDSVISKSVIVETLPIDKKIEQGNMIFHYLIATNFFTQVDKDNFKLSSEWKNKSDKLLSMCNLEYKDIPQEEAIEMAKDKNKYAAYVTKVKVVDLNAQINSNGANLNHENLLSLGENIILYGVPGCGKSYYIKENYCRNDNLIERVVFHPDYTYSDFVGQILPKLINSEDGTNSSIDYRFIPGPFTRVLKACEDDKENMRYLIIEEINRGNSPAIFGEIFQLLDRDENKGVSEYGITNADIAKEVYNEENRKVVIPNNLTILATMNTADQNVFTLDTAFKRRWKMKAIRNNFDDNSEQCDHKLCGTELTWKQFAQSINKAISDTNRSTIGSEDKRLGVYFLKKSEMNSVETFSEKILMYLWNDVFKYDHESIFNEKYNTLEDLIIDFESDKFNIFKPNLINIDDTAVNNKDNQESDEEESHEQ